MMKTVINPRTAAPIMSVNDSLDPDKIKAATIPGNTECEMASPSMVIFLSNKKLPRMAQVPATNEPVNMIQNALMILGFLRYAGPFRDGSIQFRAWPLFPD